MNHAAMAIASHPTSAIAEHISRFLGAAIAKVLSAQANRRSVHNPNRSHRWSIPKHIPSPRVSSPRRALVYSALRTKLAKKIFTH
ncbi:MAG TPA: hypothetical protein VGA05_08295 [Candidatus Bathyarchaeia archaeon]